MSQHQGLLCLTFLWLSHSRVLIYNHNNHNTHLLNNVRLQQTVAQNVVAVTMVGLLLSLVNVVTIAVTLFSNQVVVWVKVLLAKVVKLLVQRNPLDKYNQVDLTQQLSLDTFNENASRTIKSN
jgi:hypothetical protein